jgi:hypothetical protein
MSGETNEIVSRQFEGLIISGQTEILISGIYNGNTVVSG